MKRGPRTEFRGLKPLRADVQEALLSTLRERQAKLHTMRARLQGRLGAAGVRKSFSQVVVFHHPDRLRVELFATQINRLISLLISENGVVEAYLPEQQTAYRGAATAANFARLLRVPFTPQELMLWLAAETAIPEDDQLKAVELLRSENRERLLLDLLLLDGRRVLAAYSSADGRVENLRLASLEIIRAADEEPLFFSEFHYQDAERFPERISLAIPTEGLKGQLVFLSREINPNISPAMRERLFRSRIPASVEIYPIALVGDPLL